MSRAGAWVFWGFLGTLIVVLASIVIIGLIEISRFQIRNESPPHHQPIPFHTIPCGSITQAIDLFKYNLGRYPQTLDELMHVAEDDPDRDKWSGPYLRNENGLLDPWGRTYKYAFPGIHNKGKYDIWSVGPNGKDESSEGNSDDGDDFRNWK